IMNACGLGRAVGVLAVASGMVAAPTYTWAQNCPPELAAAKQALAAAPSSTEGAVMMPRSLAGARDDVQAPRAQDEVQAPRTLVAGGAQSQAPRGQEIQAARGRDIRAARGQDIQAPRGQDIQAPRGQDEVQAPRTLVGAREQIQAPRGQDIQAPRGQDIQAP